MHDPTTPTASTTRIQYGNIQLRAFTARVDAWVSLFQGRPKTDSTSSTNNWPCIGHTQYSMTYMTERTSNVRFGNSLLTREYVSFLHTQAATASP